MKKAKKYIVKGVVQGVGFRYFTNHLANKIGLYGYVKNVCDGSVEIYAIGSDAQLENLRTQISVGPRFSRVEHVCEEEAEIDAGCYSFKIKF